MNVAVGLLEHCPAIEVDLDGTFFDAAGRAYASGRHRFDSEITLAPSDPSTASFAIEDIRIGIGFHWERGERQIFRGSIRIVQGGAGLTPIHAISLGESPPR